MTCSTSRRRAGAGVTTLLVLLGGCFDPTGDDPITTGLGSDDTGGSDEADDATTPGGSDPSGNDPSGDPSTDPSDDDSDPSGDPSGDPTGEPTSTTDVDSGTDDDATGDDDPTTDSGPAACDGTCVPDVPAGWEGPVVVREGAGAPPACPGEFPALVHDELHTGLQAGAASCDCECGDVVGATCGAATLQQAGNMCIVFLPDPQEWVLNPSSCAFVNIGPDEYSVIAPPLGTGGASCSPQTTENIPTPTWSDSVRSCAVPAGDACDGGTCAPSPTGEFDALCIWIEGDAACPAGAYSEVRHAYGDYSDDRDCTACSCGTPTGECAGEVVFTDVSCGGDAFYVDSIGADACSTLGDGATHAQWFPEVDADCTPGGGNLQGDVEPTEAVTYCCLP
jgi:hypothetical protein